MAETKHGYSAHYAILSATASGQTEVIEAKTGVRFRVIACYMISSNTNTVTFQSGSTAKTAEMDFTSQERMELGENEYGWFSTDSGEALNVNLTNANKIAGMITYVET